MHTFLCYQRTAIVIYLLIIFISLQRNQESETEQTSAIDNTATLESDVFERLSNMYETLKVNFVHFVRKHC
jgi:hypothetical protein